MGGGDGSGGATGGTTGGSDGSGGTSASGGSGNEGGEAGVGNPGSGGTGGSGGDDASGGTVGATGGSDATGGTDATGGSGGSSGVGGASGGGASGGGASGGGAGAGGSSPGTGGSAGTGGSPPATGCAVLTTALDAEDDQAHFVVTLPADTDFTDATVSVRLHVSGATGGSLFMYVQQATYEFWGQEPQALSGFSGLTTIDWNVGEETTTGVDKTLIRRIGIEINGDGSATWTDPTIVYLDSITVTQASLSFPFDGTGTVYTTPASSHSSDTALWLNSATADTTALEGSSVAWSETCP